MIALIWNALFYACLIVIPLTLAGRELDYMAAQREMISEIRASYRVTSYGTGLAEPSAAVTQVLEHVPRHEFVPAAERDSAYENHPLPIGHGQTISQPFMVAVMTDLLSLGKTSVVLEIGTGSGYQAAILASMVRQVYTLEIIPELGKEAAERLHRLGYQNVEVKIGDGYHGWQAHAPYDGIIVTAGGQHVPQPLIEQLKPGGTMLLPVGVSFLTQYLVLVEKDMKGDTTMRQVLPVNFVPLTGEH